jgi:hypothetical protein
MAQLAPYALEVIQLKAVAAAAILITTCMKPMDAHHALKPLLTVWTAAMLIPALNVWMDSYCQQIVQPVQQDTIQTQEFAPFAQKH